LDRAANTRFVHKLKTSEFGRKRQEERGRFELSSLFRLNSVQLISAFEPVGGSLHPTDSKVGEGGIVDSETKSCLHPVVDLALAETSGISFSIHFSSIPSPSSWSPIRRSGT